PRRRAPKLRRQTKPGERKSRSFSTATHCHARLVPPPFGICNAMPRIKQAFVLGAGLGTRLRPLTDELPKPLIPIFQKPLVTFAIDHLISTGIDSFVVNTHRFPNLFEDLFTGGKYSGHSVTLVHEPDLLET